MNNRYLFSRWFHRFLKILCHLPGVWIGTALICNFVPSVSAKYFPLSGQNVWLQEVTGDIAVEYRALRFNRAIGAWNLDLSLTNKSGRDWVGAWVVMVKNYAGTSGPIKPDGILTNDMNRAFYEVTSRLPNRTLTAGLSIPIRTITLGFVTNQAPRLDIQVYVTPQADWQPSLALVWTLNETGLPLPEVQVEEQGPMGNRKYASDAAFGVVTLGQDTGEHTWKFTRNGYLPVWRKQTLLSGFANWMPHPRLTMRSATNAVAPGAIRFVTGQSGASGPADLLVTPLASQTLPALLPSGWSPLQAFWLETQGKTNSANALFAVPVSMALKIWDTLRASETAYLARWNEDQLQWRAISMAPGADTNVVTVMLSQAGAYALVVGDAAPFAPPKPQAGELLEGSAKATVDWSQITASGKVDPEINRASKIGELVTARAAVYLTNNAGATPSGLALRGWVQESYQLNGGGWRTPPQYEVSLSAYHRPGAEESARLQAELPMRPLLLYSEEELSEAAVSIDVLPPEAFASGVLGTNESVYRFGEYSLTTRTGDFLTPQALAFRTLNVAQFQELVPEGAVLVGGFELTIGSVIPGRSIQFSWTPPNPSEGYYILGRVMLSEGIYGVAPIERFLMSTNGWVSVEPVSDSRLPGIVGAGQYFLVRVAGPQALVQGTARDASQKASAGMVISVDGQPWHAVSGNDGRYQVTAPQGSAQLQVHDQATGFYGSTVLRIADASQTYVADLAAVPSGPRVTTISPAAGAYNVPRVASIVISFSEPINPGTLGTNGIALLTTNLQPVAASLSLNLKNTTATLLPKAQLAANMRYTVQITTNLMNLNGLKLQGASVFYFTTERAELDRSTARVTSYEPTNGLARLVGSAGIADPESAVILVNETSGQSATVLSKVDGSFDNFIEAGVDDFLSAVIINANETRTAIPVTRQIFRDGSVGLFQAGGILEAQSDGGPIEVIVEPGAIPNKTRIRLQEVPLSQILAALRDNPPEMGEVVGGFKLNMEGDALLSPPQIRVSVPAERLGLDPGEKPEDRGYLLVQPLEYKGAKVYQSLEEGYYENGSVRAKMSGMQAGNASASADQTASTIQSESKSIKAAGWSPFSPEPDFFATIAVRLKGGAGALEVNGVVISALFDANGKPINGTGRKLPGAVVAAGNFGLLENGALRNGALVGLADDKEGRYRVVLFVNQLMGASVRVVAMSPFFPHQVPDEQRTYLPPVEKTEDYFPQVSANLIFSRNPTTPSNIPDNLPPTVTVTHSPNFPSTNQTVSFKILANDETSISQVNATISSVRDARTDAVLPASNVSFQLLNNAVLSAQTIRSEYSLSLQRPRPTRVVVSVLALDNASHSNSVDYPIEFVAEPPPPLQVNTNDHSGPFVVSSIPKAGDQEVAVGSSIELVFNEYVDPAFTPNPGSVFAITPAPNNLQAIYLPNEKKAVISFSPQVPGQSYTLTVNSQLRDYSGNAFDQVPGNNPTGPNAAPSYDPFILNFKTAALPVNTLPGISQGGGVLFYDRYVYEIDRKKAGNSLARLLIYKVDNPAVPQRLSTYELSDYPRDFIVIPRYSFKIKENTPVITATLLVAAGGLTGSEGQWIEVINITNPNSPQKVLRRYVSNSPAAAVTRLLWSPPMLGLLLSEADLTSIQLVNLQLLIYASNLTSSEWALEPANGRPGRDENGDGDFVDAQEELPRPSLLGPSPAGLINSGLIETYSMQGENRIVRTTQRILDFSLTQNGRFVAAIVSQGVELNASGNPTSTRHQPGYRTFTSGGIAVQEPNGAIDLDGELRRMLVLADVKAYNNSAGFLGNLALISATSSSGTHRFYVVDITDPVNPACISTNTIASSHGSPYSLLKRDDGYIVIAASQDMMIVDPWLLMLPDSNDSTKDHPSIVGIVPGIGMGGREFVAYSSDFFAVCFGGRNLMLGYPPVVDLIVNAPGTLLRPGPVLPEAFEENPGLVAFVNNDQDSRAEGSFFDIQRDDAISQRTEFDDDLIAITLAKIPPRLKGKIPKKVCLKYESNVPKISLFNLNATPVAWTSTQANELALEDASGAPGGLLQQLLSDDIYFYCDANAPSEEGWLKFQVRDEQDQLLGEDKVRLSFVSVTVTQIWSNQYEGSKANLLPGNAGKGMGSSSYIIMANRDDGCTYVRAGIHFEPVNSPLIQKIKGGLYLPFEDRMIGVSQVFQNEIRVRARDDRNMSLYSQINIPLLFDSLVFAPLKIEEFLVVGLDYDFDGMLGKSEIRGGLKPLEYRRGNLNILPIDTMQAFLSPHFKVVTKMLYENQRVLGFGKLLEVNPAGGYQLAFQIWGLAGQPSVMGYSIPIANTMMFRFLTGNFPAINPVSPESEETFQVPDNVHKHPGDRIQNHNTGPYVNGYYPVPYYHFSADSIINKKIIDYGQRPLTNRIINIINQNIANNPQFLAQLRSQASSAIYDQLFEANISLPAGSAEIDALVDKDGFGDNDSSDLHYGIATFSYKSISLKVWARIRTLTYTPGSTLINIDRVDYNMLLFDFFDYQYQVNPFGAILGAGYDTYGQVGRPFVWDCPVQGSFKLNPAIITP